MKVYNLKNKDIMKLHNEFNKTPFGKRVKVWSIVPLFFSLLFAIAIVVSLNTNDVSAGQVICFIISTMTLCITQIMYGNMLKEYINDK